MVDSATQPVNTQYLPASYLDANGDLKAGISPDKAAEVSKGIQARVADMSTDERGLYLAIVKSPDFAPVASTSVTDTEEMLSKMESVADRLSLSTNANAARLLGRALVELGAQQRQEALNDRLTARTTARAELVAGAEKLRDGAEDLKAGAKSAMITGIVTSAISIGFAVAGGVAGTKAMYAARGGDKAAADAASALGQASSAIGNAIASMGQSISQYQSAVGQANSQLAQADQSELQAEAEVTKSEGELETSEQQALQEFVNQLIQFLKEMRDAEVEQMAVVTRG